MEMQILSLKIGFLADSYCLFSDLNFLQEVRRWLKREKNAEKKAELHKLLQKLVRNIFDVKVLFFTGIRYLLHSGMILFILQIQLMTVLLGIILPLPVALFLIMIIIIIKLI